MKANIITALQGSDEWHQHRANHYNASDLAAAMGMSPYKSRNELIREKATGFVRDIDEATQRRFAKGHEYEATARPWAEEIIGDDLFPVVLAAEVDGVKLSASMDGLTMMDDVSWEHKSGNAELLESLKRGTIPAAYHPQLEQGLMLSGANRCLFMASSGDRGAMCSAWYDSSPELRAKIIPTWRQLAKDIAAYQPEDAQAPSAVGRTPETLPALRIEVTGMVTASNLADYKAHALAVFSGINRELKTDQQFADAEKVVKWCGDIESRLAAAKQHAQSQMGSIDDLFRALDDIGAESRRTRLELDKLVKARKEAVRGEIVAGGIAALRDHIAGLNNRLGKNYMPAINADFAGAVKGRRTVASLQDAVDTTLANAKIEASATADRIQANLATLRELATDHAFLFADTAQIVLKAHDDLSMLVKSRIAEHQQKEAARIEAETARIRAEVESAARLQIEAEATARREAEATERARLAEEARAKVQTPPVLVELSPAAQVPNEAEGVKRFAAAHPKLAAIVAPTVIKPSTRALLNARLDRLSDADLMRLLSFVQSRWPDAQAA